MQLRGGCHEQIRNPPSAALKPASAFWEISKTSSTRQSQFPKQTFSPKSRGAGDLGDTFAHFPIETLRPGHLLTPDPTAPQLNRPAVSSVADCIPLQIPSLDRLQDTQPVTTATTTGLYMPVFGTLRISLVATPPPSATPLWPTHAITGNTYPPL
ncbi:hypothetical protein VTJ04DRAFT_5721 [Mycothermus thermophilus]|uniref:uncharacterized protein n=1 Tax=Humicola insolens TaxID=85995 RepID=UPI003742792F